MPLITGNSTQDNIMSNTQVYALPENISQVYTCIIYIYIYIYISQRVSEKLTRTVALQRVQSAQETMICSYWYYIYNVLYIYNVYV